MSKIKTKANKNQITSLDKYYNIFKILLTLTPVMSLMYLSMESSRMGLPMQQVVQENPKITIMFLVSMINPFIAYLIMFIQKKIRDNDVEYAVVNLTLFIVAEILLQNILYVVIFGYILYKTLNTYNLTIGDSFKSRLNNGFFMTISGSLVVIVLSGICLFSNIMINM